MVGVYVTACSVMMLIIWGVLPLGRLRARLSVCVYLFACCLVCLLSFFLINVGIVDEILIQSLARGLDLKCAQHCLKLDFVNN